MTYFQTTALKNLPLQAETMTTHCILLLTTFLTLTLKNENYST